MKHTKKLNTIKVFFIIIGSIIGILFATILVLFYGPNYKDDPRNWNAFFSFYRSQECIKNDNTIPEDCFLQGLRVNNDSTTIKDAIDSLDIYYTKINEKTFRKENKLDTKDWNCKNQGDNRKYNLEKDIQQKGMVFQCWPKTLISNDITLVSSLYP